MGRSRPLQDLVVGIVRHNTGGPQRDTIDTAHVKVIACGNAGHDPSAVERALADAVSDDQLVKEGGRYRIS